LKAWPKRMGNEYHQSVLIREAIDALHIKKTRLYIDATLGHGGHALEIIRLGGKVLGIDLDPEMVETARQRIETEAKKGEFKFVSGNFTDITKIAAENAWMPVSGILFDLGVSNLHLKDLKRGFSFESEAAMLDMRLNPKTQEVTGADLLNVLREDQLEDLFGVTLDPGAAKWICGRVMHSRAAKPVQTVGDLLEICRGLKTGKTGLNEATLPFLALRIAVNSELTNLEEVLPKAFALLEKGGRLVVISFHSKEDAIVKNFFKDQVKNGAKIISYKPILAGPEEVFENKRARSAKMRILEK
jgi:16S rRNA (cytosine1402-N4)-methyltransferase